MPLSLFDDLDLPAEELLPFDGSAILHRNALAPEAAHTNFDELLNRVSWEQPELTMWGKLIPQPRLSAWFGGPEAAYSYSGLTMEPTPWIGLLEELRERCEEVAGCSFNSVLANLYRDGSDSVAWHSDDEVELGLDPVIASLSLGAPRRFDMRHKQSGKTVRSILPPGSIVVMSGQSQSLWQHQVAKTKKPVGPRINLTFRTITRSTETKPSIERFPTRR